MHGFFIKKACQQESLSLIYTSIGGVAKLVDALDLGSSAARCKSSSLFAPTKFKKQGYLAFFMVKSEMN